jgi:hypothetical protein
LIKDRLYGLFNVFALVITWRNNRDLR